jgi:acetyl-CoA carboxylase biotin carboxyl carrier protein
MKLNLDQLRELIQLLDEANLTEIEVERDDDRIRIRREPAPATALAPARTDSRGAAQAAQSTAAEAAQDGGIFVTSPFVGTFYRAPSPEDDPFVEVGDRIAPGQVLCIVEAMKLMNEIEADMEGEIAEILVENGKPVEYGDRLFRIETA